jgi:flagellar basal-body rod protein FlgF
MDNPGYAALTRQSGLMREMQVVANNMANMASTTGYRREGVVFAEFIVRALENGHDSLSMARRGASYASELQGALTRTGGPRPRDRGRRATSSSRRPRATC